MATYVIGDIQGCFKAFRALLKQIQFNSTSDRLWLAGDLVNRGPDNVSVLRFCRDLGDSVKVVLGNHDLHLLAAAEGVRPPNKKDTIQDVLNASDKDDLLLWLRQQPLVICDQGHCLSHAGIPHIWTCTQAQQLASEVEQILAGEHYHRFLSTMYGNSPNQWHDDLDGSDRLRVITNYLTRMRFVDPRGKMDFAAKTGPEKPPLGMLPWYAYSRHAEDQGIQFLFGHWAALDGHTGIERYQALDTGCVWGGYLTSYCIENGSRSRVSYKATPKKITTPIPL